MTITGLDSAYSAQNGGPVRVPPKDGWTGKFQEIRDTIRISDLQVRVSSIEEEDTSITIQFPSKVSPSR